jgi:hypothetical protein
MSNKGAFLWNIEKTVSKGDYIYAVVKNHPKATKNGYVLLHRVVMENYLGRLLNENEVVHHKDENKKNNNIDNLELMDRVEHVSYHGKMQGKSMVLLKCPYCEKKFTKQKRQTFLRKPSEFTCCGRKCMGKISKYIQLYGRTQEMEKAISENLLKEFNSLDNSEVTVLQQEP